MGRATDGYELSRNSEERAQSQDPQDLTEIGAGAMIL
jgi:hypothetical protein